MKDNFVAGMIHDIRNPLSSMICSVEFMKESEAVKAEPELANMIDVASHCAEFIISHVGNFLDFSKLETSTI
jgi:signal transduction histidine kinase